MSAVGRQIEGLFTTQRSLWSFSRRMTGPPWNLTFADAVEQVKVGDCGRSPVPADDRDKFAAEWLHPKVANWR